MKTIVLICHPHMEQSVVNRQLAAAINHTHNITVRYLYDLYPNFEINIKLEQQLLETFDRIVFQFPFYWYSAPSLLREYLDQVLTYGWAYGEAGNALKGKECLLAVTCGAHEAGFSAKGKVHYTVTDLLRPFQATCRYVGMKYLTPFIIYDTVHLTQIQLDKHCIHYRSLLQNSTLPLLGIYD